MIHQRNVRGLVWYEFNTIHFCIIAFSLSDILRQLPLEVRNICLTQLN